MANARFATLLSSLLLLTATNGEQMNLQDSYLTCPGNEVPDNAHGLPQGYSPADYFSVMQLCSALNGNARNVGCVCTSSQPSSFHCVPSVADPVLYNAVITNSQKSFPTFCAESCFCTDAETAEMDRRRDENEYYFRRADMTQPGNHVFDPSNSNYGPHQPGGTSEGGYRIFTGDPWEGWEGGDNLNKGTVSTNAAVAHSQCWANCTSNADCSKGGEKGCMCSTQREQYQPGSGTVAFVAACIISISGVGGKREEMRPCPCNATYVSHACCGAADGLVCEEERFKLGELVVEHDL